MVDIAYGLRSSSDGFQQFGLLPLEIQLRIWELTLTTIASIRAPIWNGSTTVWPVLELPSPPRAGHCYGEIPKLAAVQDADAHPAALHVCQASRIVALGTMLPIKNAAYHAETRQDYISRKDIASPRIGARVVRGVQGPTKTSRTATGFGKLRTTLKELSLAVPLTLLRAFPNCEVDHASPFTPNPFFDIDSGRLCIVYPLPNIWTRARTSGFEAHLSSGTEKGVGGGYDERNNFAAMRLAGIEEWTIGERITIGTVPSSLMYGNSQDPWKQRAQAMRHGLHVPRPFDLGPSRILSIYSCVLHQLALGPRQNCRFSQPSMDDLDSELRDTFMAIMQGEDCPECGEALLEQSKLRHGKYLDLTKLDILVLTDRMFLGT